MKQPKVSEEQIGRAIRQAKPVLRWKNEVCPPGHD